MHERNCKVFSKDRSVPLSSPKRCWKSLAQPSAGSRAIFGAKQDQLQLLAEPQPLLSWSVGAAQEESYGLVVP